MPRVRKAPDDLEGKQRRKPVRNVRKSRLQVSGIRENAGRRNRAAPAPATAQAAGPDLLLEENHAARADQAHGPADRLTPGILSPETLAAAAAIESDAAQAANVNGQDAHDATDSAPAASDTLELQTCIKDAAELIDWAWSTVQALGAVLPPRTSAVLSSKITREQIATATGRLFHHYGIAGTDIVTNPWAGLALALAPVGFAAFTDWREARARAAEQAAPTPPAPTPGAGTVAEAGAPPSNLHRLL